MNIIRIAILVLVFSFCHCLAALGDFPQPANFQAKAKSTDPNDNESRPKTLLRVDFNEGSDNDIAERLLAHQHNELARGKGPDGSDALRTAYVGCDRGSERVVMQFPLEKAVQQATLAFDVCFEEDFQWVRCGKLHGLGPANPITGGRQRKPEGWSARLMFEHDGRCATYLYDQNVSETYGIGSTSRQPVFTRGKWHHVTMQVGLNTSGKKDGFARFSIDGKPVLETGNVEFRGKDGSETLIRQFLFSTFHGGSSPSYAPKDSDGKYVTVHAMFDNFEVVEGVE